MPILLLLLAIASPLLGQISFDPICLYDEPLTCYELTDLIATHDGNVRIAWAFWNFERGGSKVHTFSSNGEPLGDPIAIIDVPLSELGCKPKTQIAQRPDRAWAALTIYS